ncbi:MAG: 3-phosphoshikimate 1-carboxyvinyltransferase [Acidobacteriota bacterium]
MTPSVLPGPRNNLCGIVHLPPSKSLTNRALVAAAAAGGGTVVSPLDCDDTRVLARALEAAGWQIDWDGDIRVGERRIPGHWVGLDLADSGTGARLILGLLAASPGTCIIDGSRRLRERPLRQLVMPLCELGAIVRTNGGHLPVEVEGRTLDGGAVAVRPEVSSQFVSSLLMAGPLMRSGLRVTVEGQLPSAPYLDLTEDVLCAFGARVEAAADRRHWRVWPGGLEPTLYPVEGDWSAAAFFAAAAAVAGGTVELGPLDCASRQGDRAVLHILADGGLSIHQKPGNVVRVSGPVQEPLRADLAACPDLFPALAVVCAAVRPGSKLSGLDHLRHKESDRLALMADNLHRLGARVRVDGTTFEVEKTMTRVPGAPRRVSAGADHRIAMAMAVAALVAGPLELDEPSCVAKSFPEFWETWDVFAGGAGEGAG